MPRKRLAKTYTFMGEKGNTIEILGRVVNEIGKSGYKVMPSAQTQLAKYLVQARRKRTLATDHEIVVGASAFITVSAQASSGHKITVKDINAAWKYLRRCPGNLPPPKCMRRSIIDYEGTLKSELTGFSEIIDAITKRR